jgi:spore coat protein H
MRLEAYDLTMHPSDLSWFQSHIGTARCFAATLRMNDQDYPVWIGYRGRYSRRFRKPSYDIWFGQARPLGGAGQIHLNAAYRDPSLLRGKLALELFGEIGVPVPRSWHIWLNINSQPCGVYTAIESLDGDWLRRRHLQDGAIYYAVGDQGNFGLLDPVTGRPKRYLAAGYEKCFPPDDEFGDLVELIYRITLPDPDEFAETIGRLIDVDNFLRWLIGLEFMSHTDGLVQNYALIRPGTSPWRISPWDCDGTWGRYPDGGTMPHDLMDVGTGEDNYLLARLLRCRNWRERYLELWSDLLSGVLSGAHIEAKTRILYAAIREAVLADHSKRWSNTTFRREPDRIRCYLERRTAFIRRRLVQMETC